MRADRLLSLLMLLQTKGKITASFVASELEISERTARRDLEALMMSGVPIYSQPGRGGGWQLIGDATTDLTGLSSNEATAMFLAVGPLLGDDPSLRSGLLKLLSALPEPFRVEAQAATDAIKVDDAGWGRLGPSKKPAFLDELTKAVVGGKQVDLTYTDRAGNQSQRVVHPLGLVTKRGVWYLVSNTPKGIRTFRLSRVSGIKELDAPVERPSDFDLEAEWERIVSEMETRRMPVRVTATIRPDLVGPMRWIFGRHVRSLDGDDDSRLLVEVRSQSALTMAAQIAGFGNGIELVDAPDAVVKQLRRITTELHRMYGINPDEPTNT